MKVIDLLNKIANGRDVPRKIKYYGLIYEFCSRCKQYEHFDEDKILQIKLFEEIVDLNDKVEIIEDTPKEDKKIEKIEERIDTGLVGTEILDEFKVAGAINKQASYIFDIAKKINEIIDKVNGDK